MDLIVLSKILRAPQRHFCFVFFHIRDILCACVILICRHVVNNQLFVYISELRCVSAFYVSSTFCCRGVSVFICVCCHDTLERRSSEFVQRGEEEAKTRFTLFTSFKVCHFEDCIKLGLTWLCGTFSIFLSFILF